MRQHDNFDPYFNIQKETVLQRVDYDNIPNKKPFNTSNSSLGYLNCYQRPLELDIEIEVNESLQLLLNSTKTSKDTDLIDVTLIRETPSLQETTVSLGKPEVKRFLDMVSRNQNGRNYTNEPKIRRSRTAERKASYKPCTLPTTDEEDRPFECISCGIQDDQTIYTDSIYTDFSEQTYDNFSNGYQINRHEKVYASPDMFSKLKSSLVCQHNKKYNSDNKKPGTPCLCQHCGMIGVLIESQKRPFIPHPTVLPETNQNRSRSEYRKDRRPRTVGNSNYDYSPRHRHENYNAQTKVLSKESLFEDLLSKLQSLEARVLEQEEKAVGKDYFQYVIRKILSQYIAKIVQSELPDNVKSSGTQYSCVYLGESEIGAEKSSSQRRHPRRRKSSGRDSSGTNSREKSLDGNQEVNMKPEQAYNKKDPKLKSVPKADLGRQSKNKNVRYFNEASPICNKKHWKDIRSEKDLKDRILSLIEREDSFENRKTPELNCSKEKPNSNKEIKVESFQNTLYLPQVIRSGRLLVEPEQARTEKERPVTTSGLKDLLDNMSSQIYEDLMKSKNNRSHSPLFKEEKPRYNNMEKAMDDTLFKRNIEASKKREMLATKNSRKETRNIYKCEQTHASHKDGARPPLDNLDIKYLKPAADIWGESSNADLLNPICQQSSDKADNKIFAKDSLTYKIEYLKGLARSKNINEEDLWKSIWRQTKNRFKSKNDILTISIPSRKQKKRAIELELTWSDLKEIMRSTRTKSSFQVSSCDLLHNQNKKRESTLNQNEYTRKNHSYKVRSKSVK